MPGRTEALEPDFVHLEGTSVRARFADTDKDLQTKAAILSLVQGSDQTPA